KQYKRDLVDNADFRKFDDGLRMTLDCSPAFADRLEAKLAAASFVEWGTHRQDRVQITCFWPPSAGRGHLHFVDGAGGGYTMAARRPMTRTLPWPENLPAQESGVDPLGRRSARRPTLLPRGMNARPDSAE